MGERGFQVLNIDGITRKFGDSTALSALSLTVRKGEFVALLGPSGCGKSTALNCIAGLLPLTDGRISVDDERIDILPSEKRGFGMVFQNYALFPHLTVARNVAFGLQMAHVSKPEITRRVRDALRLVQLEDHADKRPRQLSGGQQQRVAIARAVVMEPRLVLMDEPLSNLDAKLRLEMRSELRRLHKSLGLTTIYVTHDQEEALSLADRLVVLRRGVMQQVGTPEEVFAAPANKFVANFMGYRNMIPAVAQHSPAIGLTTISSPYIEASVKTHHKGKVTVAIRPEDLTRAPAPGNRISGTVESIEYQGREYETRILTANGATVYMRGSERCSVGEPITVGIRSERVMVYPGHATDEDSDLVSSGSDGHKS